MVKPAAMVFIWLFVGVSFLLLFCRVPDKLRTFILSSLDNPSSQMLHLKPEFGNVLLIQMTVVMVMMIGEIILFLYLTDRCSFVRIFIDYYELWNTPGAKRNKKCLCYNVIALAVKDNKYVLIDSLMNHSICVDNLTQFFCSFLS